MEEGNNASVFNFEDDLFEIKSKETSIITIPPFVPRNYYPREEKVDEKTMSVVRNDKKLFKYHADYLYFSGKYEEATNAYQQLEILFKDNPFMCRAVKESLVWCFIKTNSTTDALPLAEKLFEEATTFEQQMSSRYLLNVITGKVEDSESILNQVQSLEKNVPEVVVKTTEH